MNRRFRASYRIAIGFAVLALLSIYGYRYANDFLLGRDRFAPIVPGDVNILGVSTNAGYGILVQNRVVKLVLGNSDKFGPGEMDDKGLEGSGSDRKFIPIKEMLQGMRGDDESLGFFVEKLNEIDSSEAPDAALWKVEDLQKAMSGDTTLRAKLVRDLNMEIDGTPLDHVSKSALFNGILVDVPIPIHLAAGGKSEVVASRVKRNFRPAFLVRVENRLKNRNIDLQTIATEYAAEVEDIKNGTDPKIGFAASLQSLVDQGKDLALVPQRILNSVTPIINENQVTGARYTVRDEPKGKQYTLIIALSEEGKKRLYQYSRDRVGDKMLVTVHGVAIAAPRIDHALSSGEVEISGLEDESLVQEAVNTINSTRKTTNENR